MVCSLVCIWDRKDTKKRLMVLQQRSRQLSLFHRLKGWRLMINSKFYDKEVLKIKVSITKMDNLIFNQMKYYQINLFKKLRMIKCLTKILIVNKFINREHQQ
jgi:hypothetical protein